MDCAHNFFPGQISEATWYSSSSYQCKSLHCSSLRKCVVLQCFQYSGHYFSKFFYRPIDFCIFHKNFNWSESYNVISSIILQLRPKLYDHPGFWAENIECEIRLNSCIDIYASFSIVIIDYSIGCSIIQIYNLATSFTRLSADIRSSFYLQSDVKMGKKKKISSECRAQIERRDCLKFKSHSGWR